MYFQGQVFGTWKEYLSFGNDQGGFCMRLNTK